MSSTWDWYSTNRKGYRKKKQLKVVLYIYTAHVIRLISSGYVTVYFTTFSHVVFSSVTLSTTSEVDSFFNYT